MLRPNILLIIGHDLGAHVGCYGVSTVQSPNIDRLAAEGVRMAEAFCCSPQCSTSRAALYTGRYPHSNGVMGLAHGEFEWGLKPDEQHLAQLLGNLGWETTLLGIQHESPDARRLGYRHNESGYFPADKLAAKTAEFLQQWVNRQRMGSGRLNHPFFLQVGFFEPHRQPGSPGNPGGFGDMEPDDRRGVFVPPYLVDDPAARAEFAAYQGAIRSLDDAVGVILSTLNRLKLADDTLVIFTTDHGIPFPRAKCSLYDPGLEIAWLMRWPSAEPLRGGRVIRGMMTNVDFVPTLAELLGFSTPPRVQGRSFAGLLAGDTASGRREMFAEMTYHDYPDPRRCIRTATHKLIVNFTNAPSFMDPTQSWRPATITHHPPDPAVSYHVPVELYNLAADPLEWMNLAPSPAHAQVRRALLDRLYQWMCDTNDPLLYGIPAPPIHGRALAALTGAETRKEPS